MLNRRFSAKLVNLNKKVYCTTMDKALKIRVNEGAGYFLQLFVTKQGFLVCKKYKKMQF